MIHGWKWQFSVKNTPTPAVYQAVCAWQVALFFFTRNENCNKLRKQQFDTRTNRRDEGSARAAAHHPMPLARVPTLRGLEVELGRGPDLAVLLF